MWRKDLTENGSVKMDYIFELLEKFSIPYYYQEVDGHFSRDIEFEINDVKYVIVWYINNSYLHIGSHKNDSAKVCFRYIDVCDSLWGMNNVELLFYYSPDKDGFRGPYSEDLQGLVTSFRLPLWKEE